VNQRRDRINEYIELLAIGLVAWRIVAVTRCVRSTKLLYAGLG